MKQQSNTPFDITVELEGVQIRVTGHITPIVKGRWTDKNGDPGWPDEGGEIVIIDTFMTDEDYTFLRSIYTKAGDLMEEIELLTSQKLNK